MTCDTGSTGKISTEADATGFDAELCAGAAEGSPRALTRDVEEGATAPTGEGGFDIAPAEQPR
jgi:hypothetical protein